MSEDSKAHVVLSDPNKFILIIFIVVFVILLLCVYLNYVSVSYVRTIHRNDIVDKPEPYVNVNCHKRIGCGRKHYNSHGRNYYNNRIVRNRRLNQAQTHHHIGIVIK